MNFNILNEIFVLTARRSIKRQYRYFILDRTRLSEPEIRHVMARILEEKKFCYGIEIATKKKHKISGDTMERSALTDLVIYGKNKLSGSPIWVEFKRGQPEIGKIAKDFIKMTKEPSINGACFFHVLPKINSIEKKSNDRAKKAVIKKYSDAYELVDKDKCDKKWFVLFILDSNSKQYYFLQKNDICNIDSFDDGQWMDLK